jgi:hypothetical protein
VVVALVLVVLLVGGLVTALLLSRAPAATGAAFGDGVAPRAAVVEAPR